MSADLTTLEKELVALESALAEPQDEVTEVRLRQRHAYVSQRHAELSVLAPYDEISTPDLGLRLSEAQETREELLGALNVAKADPMHPAKAARLEREYRAFQDEQAALRHVFDARAFSEKVTVLGQARAEVEARREILAADREALSEMEGWQRDRAQDKLSESLDDRVQKRVPEVHARLIERTERQIAAELLGGRGSEPAPLPMTQEEDSDE